jgi:hypothetical protein
VNQNNRNFFYAAAAPGRIRMNFMRRDRRPDTVDFSLYLLQNINKPIVIKCYDFDLFLTNIEARFATNPRNIR